MTEQQTELLAKARRAVAAARRDAEAADSDFAAFGKEFAKTGLLPGRLHSILVKAFEARQDSDYEMLPIPTAEETAESIAAAEQFVAAVEKSLREGGR